MVALRLLRPLSRRPSPPVNLPEISAVLHANYPALHPVLDDSRPPRRTGWTCPAAAAGRPEHPGIPAPYSRKISDLPRRISAHRRFVAKSGPLLELHDPAPLHVNVDSAALVSSQRPLGAAAVGSAVAAPAEAVALRPGLSRGRSDAAAGPPVCHRGDLANPRG